MLFRVALFALLLSPASIGYALEPRVSFEVLMEDPYARDSARKWNDLLDNLPRVSVRIRSPRDGERTNIEEIEGPPKSFKVTCILTARSQLEVPGTRFSLRDKAKIQEWLDTLRNGGTESLFTPRLAFGLTAKQLTEVHERLSHGVTTSTKGKSVAQAAKLIAWEAKLTLQSDPDARQGAVEIVDNEVKGLAAGAALATVLRPGGLVLTLERPTGASGEVGLRIRRAEKAGEFWPVGWPLQGAASKLAPDMFKKLDVEINEIPIADALDAVSQRLTTPLVLDYNAMVRDGIDPANTLVSHPAGNTYYKRIIDRMLSGARLTGGWRQDEAGTVFYWITTVKQSVRERNSK